MDYSLPLPQAYMDENCGQKLVAFSIIFIPLQIVFVVLRYLSRHMVKAPYGADDVIVSLSLTTQFCLGGVAIASVSNAGVGRHIPALEASDPQILSVWGKYLVAISIIYFGTVNIPKLAILVLYRRLFPTRAIRIQIHFLMAVLIAMTFSNLVTAFVACKPFAANWDPGMKGAVCIDKEAFFVWSSVPNIVTDVVMLVLPLPVVWRLKTTIRMKIGLTITFTIGSFGLVTSILRFHSFFKNDSFIDGTFNAVELIIWTEVECGIYLISACLPTYRPLLERLGLFQLSASASSSKAGNAYYHKGAGETVALKSRGGAKAEAGLSKSQGFHKLDDETMNPDIVITTTIDVEQGRRESIEERTER